LKALLEVLNEAALPCLKVLKAPNAAVLLMLVGVQHLEVQLGRLRKADEKWG
jgi:hypothetical protein